MSPTLCLSIKSKRSTLRCPNAATRGDFCAKHCKSRVLWVSNHPPLTRLQKVASDKIHKFWIYHGRPKARQIHGPALFLKSLSHNDKDIYTFDSIDTIPFTYHFSYLDDSKRVWTFDLRFLIQLLQYGKELMNPFSQELIDQNIIERLEARSQILRRQKIPIIYAEPTGLTSEQIWNQKVLSVFLRLNSLGFGVNMIWFETMTISQHQTFYTRIFDMWNSQGLTSQEKETMVPGYKSGRSILFRSITETHDIRWWRKQTLNIMNSFLTRGQNRVTQGCGALYILTSLAHSHPSVAEVYPWL